FSDALGRTMPSMVIGMLGLLLNIPLNYILIHGKLGLPALGGVGCGWATGIVMIAMLAAMLYWVQRAETYRFSELFRHLEWPCWRWACRSVWPSSPSPAFSRSLPCLSAAWAPRWSPAIRSP